VKNVTTFHLYHKFTTEEKITFDEIPEDKPKADPEKPVVKKQP
jgi:hypothetical protein